MQDKFALFQKFLITESNQIGLADFLLNSLVAIVLSILFTYTYRVCAQSLSNRKVFAANFILITYATMLIISIVKSSLALSLGLVGALSIVRFRSAIKEPEELAYLFLNIAFGLGLGANQRLITIVAFVVIAAIIWGRYYLVRKSSYHNLYFIITSAGTNRMQLDKINLVVNRHFRMCQLKRFDENPDFLEVAYHIEIDNTDELIFCKSDLLQENPALKISYIDSRYC